MNFADYFPSLKYLCLLSAMRKGDARLFQTLYRRAVTSDNLFKDRNIHWLYFSDEYLVNGVQFGGVGIVQGHLLTVQLCAQLQAAHHEQMIVPIVSSGCAFAGYAACMLPDAVMDGLNHKVKMQLFEWLMRDRSQYMIHHLLIHPEIPAAVSEFGDSFIALCYMRNAPLNRYALKHLCQDDQSVGVHSALLYGQKCDFLYKDHHTFAMSYGLTLKQSVGVEGKDNGMVWYYEQCRDNCIAAWRTWLLVSHRLGLCRDLRQLIGRWIQRTLWWDDCWDIVTRRKDCHKM